MMLSLQKISDTIPAPSGHVRDLFNRSVTPKVVEYGTFARYVYASCAIGLSAVNTLGYGLVIVSRIPTAVPYRDFTNFTKDCRQDAQNVFQSFYFIAAMTTYLFMSILWGAGYQLKLEIPYELRPEFIASVLKSSVPLGTFVKPPECEIPGFNFKFYADTDHLRIETVTDLNFLLGVLNSRQDLVLIFSLDEKNAYLVHRSDEHVRTSVMNDTLLFHDLPPEEVPIVIPTPKEKVTSSQMEVKEDLNASRIADEFTIVDIPVEALVENQPPLSTIRLIGATVLAAWGKVVGYNHLAKEIKYRHILDHLYRLVTIGDGLAQYNQVYRSPNSPLKTECLKLYEIITNLNSVDVRKQNADFIYALREAQRLLKEHDNKACKDWIHLLAMNRFTGVKLYGYCRSLVELSSDPFTTALTFENFWEQLELRLQKIKVIPLEQGLAKGALLWQKFVGRFNLRDFLIASNIPYIYGQLKLGGQIVTILRHGTPIAPAGYFRTSQVTDDYVAFIDAAAAQNQNILHLIVENLHDTFEGVRVQARLALASKPNFFPWAIRFDGDFIEPKNYQPKIIEQTKEEFEAQMYGENTGYSVPEKLRQKGLSNPEFKGYMNSVQETFFKDQETFETLHEYQTFIVLTYAEAVLSLCTKLKISFLEALCKDDIDRGGALKAIIILLHLYKTGKFAEGNEKQLSQALEELMVNIIAAPLIVKKQPILKDRVSFIRSVIEVMKKTIAVAPVPQNVYTGNFNVLSEPHQGVTPMGSTCRTEQEYKDYLGQVKAKEIVLTTTLDQNIVQSSAQKYMQSKDTRPIAHQMNRDVKGLNMYLNSARLNPERQEDSTILQTVITRLEQANIKGDDTWSVISAFTQTIGSDLTSLLQPLFDNERLGYILKPDTDSMLKDTTSGLYLITQLDQASIKLVMLFKVISFNADGATIAKIRTTIEIPDHRVAGALITTTVDN